MGRLLRDVTFSSAKVHDKIAIRSTTQTSYSRHILQKQAQLQAPKSGDDGKQLSVACFISLLATCSKKHAVYSR